MSRLDQELFEITKLLSQERQEELLEFARFVSIQEKKSVLQDLQMAVDEVVGGAIDTKSKTWRL